MQTGRVLAGTYRLTRLLGEGGMGSVYEAEHVRLPKRFAVKFLHAEALRHPDVFARFRREAEIASGIGHPHIVDVTDFNQEDGVPYMVLEFLDGEDLAARLARHKRLPVSRAARIAVEIAGALGAAHARGVVHRDLKPQNVYLIRWEKRDDFVKVLDFGISKVLDSKSLLTRTGSVIGTPNYMSPEQVDGLVHLIDERTDIFALGAILYEMLAGRPAFDAPTVSAIFNQVCNKEPPPLAELRPDAPPALVEAAERALRKPREDRFASMEEFAEAIEAVASSVATVSAEAAGAVVSSSGAAATTPAPRPAAVLVDPPTGPAEPFTVAATPTTLRAANGQATTLRRARLPRWRMLAGAGAVAFAATAAVLLGREGGDGNGAPEGTSAGPEPAPLGLSYLPVADTTEEGAGGAVPPVAPAHPVVADPGQAGPVSKAPEVTPTTPTETEDVARREAEREAARQEAEARARREREEERARQEAEREAARAAERVEAVRREAEQEEGSLVVAGRIAARLASAGEDARRDAEREAMAREAMARERAAVREADVNMLMEVPTAPQQQEVAQREAERMAARKADAQAAAARAEDAYLRGSYADAANHARATLRMDGENATAWRLLGASACNLGDRSTALTAWRRLGSTHRQLLEYVCKRNHVSLP